MGEAASAQGSTQKKDLPAVAHFMLDFVKQVLEYGEEFSRERYFAMLEQIGNFEFTKVLASIVLNMMPGIEGVTTQDLMAWFERVRGDVPKPIRELVESQGNNNTGSTRDTGGESPVLESGTSSPARTLDRARRTLTF